MSGATGEDVALEKYLGQVRVALRGLPELEIDDILRELRSHVHEAAGTEGPGVEAELKSLGDPVELAQTYRAENVMLRAECSSSPLVILQGLQQAGGSTWKRLTSTSLFVLGYFGMGTLWAAALEKLLAPSRGGLWYTPGDLSSITLMVGGTPPVGARELLGWWVVPITLLAGCGVKYASDRIAQWSIGRYRRAAGGINR